MVSNPPQLLWFVALVEDGAPIRIMDWQSWCAITFNDRPENAHLVPAKDEVDAYLRFQRGDYPQ